MMKNLICLIVSVCFMQQVFATKPTWVNEPMSACQKIKEICAVGTGTGRIFAEQNALKAIASYFESQIKGSFKSSKGMSQKTSGDAVLSAEVDESVQTAVETFTDQMLEGALISKFYEDSDYFYALAVLDKKVASKKIKTEIQSIDERLEELLKEKKRTTYAKLVMRYKLRESLNKRHEFLTGRKVADVISYKQITRKKALFSGKKLPLYLEVSGSQNSDELKEIVKKFLVDQNYKILTKRRKGISSVVGSIKSEKLFLKVKGWVKYKFLFSLNSENKKRQKIGAMNFSVAKTGRNRAQALEKAIPEIKGYLKENIIDLNLD